MVNNFDWFREMHFLDFIRDVGKHITVNYMMAKDSVKKRLEGNTGMSFTEFSYQLVQGYDFYWLYKNRNCKLQMGGSDQWGNITTGTELIRRKSGGEAFAFTCPLLTRSDGGKFGKTEKGNIWLDPAKTSPYQFYQFWLNATDADAEKWIKIFTFLNQEEIQFVAGRSIRKIRLHDYFKKHWPEKSPFLFTVSRNMNRLWQRLKNYSIHQVPVENLSEAGFACTGRNCKINLFVE